MDIEKDSEMNFEKSKKDAEKKFFSEYSYLLKENITDCTYNINRYHEDQSPMLVYIPNKPLIFKMMKACIGIDKVEDLWIYHKCPPPKSEVSEASSGVAATAEIEQRDHKSK